MSPAVISTATMPLPAVATMATFIGISPGLYHRTDVAAPAKNTSNISKRIGEA